MDLGGLIVKKASHLVIFTIIFFMFTSVSFARAGGGGGGSGGGSGGSGGGSGSHGSSSRAESVNPISGAITMVVMTTSMIIMQRTNNILCSLKIIKKEKKCKQVLNELRVNDSNYELDKINKDVEATFYIMQKAWTEMDQDIAINYSTEKLYNNHKTKLEWMKVRNERNILKKVKLLSIRVFGMEVDKVENTRSIWVAIKGSMIDYTEKDKKIFEGNKHIPASFTEYWKFNNVNDRWILDEIKQSGDISELEEVSIIEV